MEVGYKGLLQTIADILKLLQKEDIVPASADRPVFLIAPIILFTSIFAGFAMIPIAPGIIGSGAAVGVFYLLAIISLDVVGLLMAGWASNNKYSLYGAIRGVSQVISYEVPVTLSVLAVIMICQTFDLQIISGQQGIWVGHYSDEANYLFGVKNTGISVTEIGGFLTWNIFRFPLLFFAFIIFFIATLAEANRAPFDLAEAESEIIAGFHTEYSGFRMSALLIGEYAMMLLVSFLGAILFLGSWNTPFPNIGSVELANWTSGAPETISGYAWGAFWLITKTLVLVFVQIWVRWTFPRLRVDQLMYMCWKVLTPAALIIVLAAGIWRLLMI